MIDVNKIRSLTTLEEMHRDLTEFMTNPAVAKAYVEDPAEGLVCYEDDKELVVELLEKVERRMKSLKMFLTGQSKKRGSPKSPVSEPSTIPSEQ